MAVYVPDLIRWLQTLGDNAHVGIDDGGLALEHVEDPEAYYEIGGLSDEEDLGTTEETQ